MLYEIKGGAQVDLRFFHPSEFQGWFDRMSPRLLVLLDSLRFQWDRPIRISGAEGAVGRRLGDSSLSQHNAERWGEVRAVDVLPQGVEDVFSLQDLYQFAISVGFTGIGLYKWASGYGLHLDVRIDAEPGEPAVWGAVDDPLGRRQYVGVSEFLERVA